jgi:predicted negative regulator of RcsB-dependent stress response
MEPQHRHELHENDLQHFLTHFGEWWNQHGNRILTGILIVLVLLTGWIWYRKSQVGRHEQAWQDLAVANTPERLRTLAQDSSEPSVRVLAGLRAGDAWLTESLSPDPEKAAKAPAALSQARQCYADVADNAAAALPMRLNARLGLASVAEAKKDWPEARKQYTQVTAEAGAGYATLAARAQARLNVLDGLASPVVFAATAPATQPTSKPAATQALSPR